MPIETYTKKGKDVATDVQNKFGDTGQVQITDAMLLGWINTAMVEISSTGLTLEGSATTNLLAGVTTYDLVGISALIRDIVQISVNGQFIEILKWPEFSQFVGSNTDTGAASIGSVYAGKLVLWPAPPASVVAGINIFYSAYPAPITALTDQLTVPDRYFQALCDRVLAQALELDENFDAAQVKLGHFENQMTKQLARTHEAPTDYYHAVEPKDEWV